MPLSPSRFQKNIMSEASVMGTELSLQRAWTASCPKDPTSGQSTPGSFKPLLFSDSFNRRADFEELKHHPSMLQMFDVPIAVEMDGLTRRGFFSVYRDMITVWIPNLGSRSRTLGGLPHDAVALELLKLVVAQCERNGVRSS